MPNGTAPTPLFVELLLTAPADAGLALVFPGQGSQKVGMGKDVADSFGAAKEIFSLADGALGTPISRICFEGPEDTLTSTDNAQPAILTASLGYLAAAVEAEALSGKPAYVAGHSLGEYTALVAAASLSLRDAMLLVRERGRLMAKAGRTNPGAMAAILGLDVAAADEICRASGAEPANFNLPTQTVIGGTPSAVDQAMDLAKQRGGKALPVKVSGAFHTSLMGPAASEFAVAVDGVTISPPAIPVMSNVTGMPMTTADDVRRDLREQIMKPVRWAQIATFLTGVGVTRFVEVGPGRILGNMLKRGAPEADVRSIDSVEALGATSNV